MKKEDKDLGLLDLMILFSQNKISNDNFLIVAKGYEHSFLKQIDYCKNITLDDKNEQNKMDEALKVLENLIKAINKAKQFINTKSSKDIEKAIEIVKMIYSQTQNELKKYIHNSDDNISMPSSNMKPDSFKKFVSFDGKFTKTK